MAVRAVLISTLVQAALGFRQLELQQAIMEAGFPCKLRLSVRTATNGQKGVKAEAVCTDAITDAVLTVPRWGSGMTTTYKFAKIGAGVTAFQGMRTVESPYPDEPSMIGQTYVLKGTFEGSVGETSAVVEAPAEEPATETPGPMAEGESPCELEKKSTGTGFQLVVSCKKPVKDAELKIPGFRSKRYNPFSAGGRYLLFSPADPSQVAGKEVTFEATCSDGGCGKFSMTITL